MIRHIDIYNDYDELVKAGLGVGNCPPEGSGPEEKEAAEELAHAKMVSWVKAYKHDGPEHYRWDWS